jgi:hypothetical protein
MMTVEQLPPLAQVLFWSLFLAPFGAGWLGEQFGQWLRRKYESRKIKKRA